MRNVKLCSLLSFFFHYEMECVLHGAIADTSKDALVQKLKSMFLSVDVPFFHRELVYTSTAPAVGSSGKTYFGVTF